MNVYCAACGNELPESAKFCRYCGIPQKSLATAPGDAVVGSLFSVACKVCGFVMPLDACYCRNCGNEIEKSLVSALGSEHASVNSAHSGAITDDKNEARKSTRKKWVALAVAALMVAIGAYQFWNDKRQAEEIAKIQAEQHANELERLRTESAIALQDAEKARLEAEENKNRELESMRIQAEKDKEQLDSLRTQVEKEKEQKELAELERLKTEKRLAEQQAQADRLEMQRKIGGLDKASQMEYYGKQISAHLQRSRSYPRIAQMRGWQGSVVIRLDYDAQGRSVSARVIQSSGYEVLDNDALNKVKVMQPFPLPPDSLLNSAFSVSIPINYSLN